jgi:hypothetical protein
MKIELLSRALLGLSGLMYLACTGPAMCARSIDPIARWSFDSCDARDDSGNGHDGIIHGQPQCLKGKAGQSLRFDGLDDFIQISANPDFNMNPTGFSLTLWVKGENDQTSPDSHYNIIDKSHGEGGYNGWTLQGRVDQDLLAFITGTSQGWESVSTTGAQVLDATWHHLAMTYDGKLLIFYLDGVATESLEVNGIPNGNEGDLFLATWAGKSRFFHGFIDEVQLYLQSLSEREIRRLQSQVTF